MKFIFIILLVIPSLAQAGGVTSLKLKTSSSNKADFCLRVAENFGKELKKSHRFYYNYVKLDSSYSELMEYARCVLDNPKEAMLSLFYDANLYPTTSLPICSEENYHDNICVRPEANKSKELPTEEIDKMVDFILYFMEDAKDGNISPLSVEDVINKAFIESILWGHTLMERDFSEGKVLKRGVRSSIEHPNTHYNSQINSLESLRFHHVKKNPNSYEPRDRVYLSHYGYITETEARMEFSSLFCHLHSMKHGKKCVSGKKLEPEMIRDTLRDRIRILSYHSSASFLLNSIKILDIAIQKTKEERGP